MSDRVALLDSLLRNPSGVSHVSREEVVALLTRLATLQVALPQAARRPIEALLRYPVTEPKEGQVAAKA